MKGAPLGSVSRFRAAVSMLSGGGKKTASPKGTAAMMSARRQQKPVKAKGTNKIEKVMHEFKHGELRSGSDKGPKVTNPKQAIAIALSEQKRYEKR